MIKVDIVNEVSKVAEITKVKAELAVDAVFEAMRHSMQRGERIELRGFGVFQVKPRKRGIGRNPRTGKEVRIPPGPHHPLQARQRAAEHRVISRGLSARIRVRPDPSARSLRLRLQRADRRCTCLPRRRATACGCTSLLLLLTIASTTFVGGCHYLSFDQAFDTAPPMSDQEGRSFILNIFSQPRSI